ncbi:AraC family transcriptional regulator [Pedobacter sp. MC2016-05]|uniref:AraC family transcriptional regulator n=1 Tax=Pedobacter sp. MC2016-05 TaxID=2994474 RepID=UPI00224511E2|nr:AraC family transcriptional regulator [Pedobacter sp. MC2016-05]MCX2476280.1 AraC family transcriptional regulator [Pedobacter sp. MC2016-05]
MKVLPFTMLVPDDKSVISEHICIPHFYQYLHRHDEWQITFIEKGEGTLIAGNDMHTFMPGDVFVIGAKLPHLFKSNPEYFTNQDISVAACSVYFNPTGILASLFDLPEMKLASAYLSKNKHGFKISAGYTKKISQKMFDVHHASGSDTLFAFLNLITGLQDLGENIEPLCSDLYSSNVSENEGMRLSKIINFITENYNNQISLEDVANAAFMTPQAFCRYFKKHTGHTFVSFLNEVRINDACKSLLSGQKADCISGVAYKAGFNSITNFNRVFKSIIGQSPRAYIDTYNSVSRVTYVSA